MVLGPFVLMHVMVRNTPAIVRFVKEVTDESTPLGAVCLFSTFHVARNGRCRCSTRYPPLPVAAQSIGGFIFGTLVAQAARWTTAG